MWELLARFILRQRVLIIVVIALLTAYAGYRSNEVRLQWEMPKMLPADDSTWVAYEEFKDRFGSPSSAFLIALDKNPLDSLELFNEWYRLSKDLEKVYGVDTVISINRLFNVVKDTANKRFELQAVVDRPLVDQSELDSVATLVRSLPFYRGVLYNDSTGVNLMAITLSTKVFNSPEREPLIENVMGLIQGFEKDHGIELHYSGMPYIRSENTHLIKGEISKFIALAALVTIIILILFFRSFPPVMVSVMIVALGVVWSLGIMAVLDFEITILTSIIPPLIIVIGIPNSIYLVNKYHAEYMKHGNKVLALTRIIKSIGSATLMTNTTTAIGFLAFVVTKSSVLVEFGIVASLSIFVLFFLSIFLIPSILSFLAPPKRGQTKHLELKWVKKAVESLVFLVNHRRSVVYWTTAVIVAVAIFGVTRIRTTGNLVDDLPKDHKVITDLQYFEKHFNGVMPFEIEIDAQKPEYALKSSTLKRIDRLEDLLGEYKEFSRPMGIDDAMKFAKQAYYGGNEYKYDLISSREAPFLKPYFDNTKGNSNVMSAYVDSTKQYTRVTASMKDVGTAYMDSLLADLRPKVDSIFNPERYNVSFTGSAIVYLAGTNYLVDNLIMSLALAILVISILMATLFGSIRMIAMSIFTNLIPLLITAAMMGYFDIALKPSTILVFSIAFGIAIDDTIHFLAKYRQELKKHEWDIKLAVVKAIRETGVSMIYTSIILFFGFSVFDSSQFGGTQALGVLVSITLLIAMIANLVLLPSFLLTLDKAVTTKAFSEPFIEIYDEEVDIEYGELTIREDDPYVGTTPSSNSNLNE